MIDLSNENIVHIRKNGIEYLQFKRLLGYGDILTHCFSLKPLDFGTHKNYEETKEKIADNYKLICNDIGIDYENIVRPKQTHTDIVKEVNNEKGISLDLFNEVDGLITNKNNRALSLTFADCTPIYLFDPVKKAIGNVHSGWRGTVKRIAGKAIDKMVEVYGCNPKDIICAIGPTIRKCHFEVEDDVKDIFYNEFGYIDNIIESCLPCIKEVSRSDGGLYAKNKYLVNTVTINKTILIEKGVREENIIDSKICTVCNSSLIHSYRGDKQSLCRNTAIIMLK